MKTKHIDQLLRSFSLGVSRRSAMVSLAGGLVGALPLVLTSAGTGAENKKRGKRKNRKKRKQQTPTSPPPFAPVTNVDATCSGPLDGGLGAGDGNFRIAETFTALASAPLVRVELPIYKLAGSGGAYILRISPVDGADFPTNTVLASASIPNLSVPEEENFTATFTFANPASVVAGTKYALVLTRPGSNHLAWKGHLGSTCSGGLFSSPSQTAAFTASAAILRLNFTTFVTS